MTSWLRQAAWTVVVLFASACGSASPGTAVKAPPAEAADSTPSSTQAAPPVPQKFEPTHQIVIKTSLGSMTFELYGKQAPKTVENFIKYIEADYFHGKIFHRVIDGFMIQGGGFDENLSRGETEDPIRLELIPGLKHTMGVLSMARQPSDIHSATSQFFVCVGDAPQLNGAYAAFGRLISGEETLFAISRVATHTVETDYGKMNDVPIKPVFIESVTLL